MMMFMHCQQRRFDCVDSNVIRNLFKGTLSGMAPKKVLIKYMIEKTKSASLKHLFLIISQTCE